MELPSPESRGGKFLAVSASMLAARLLCMHQCWGPDLQGWCCQDCSFLGVRNISLRPALHFLIILNQILKRYFPSSIIFVYNNVITISAPHFAELWQSSSWALQQGLLGDSHAPPWRLNVIVPDLRPCNNLRQRQNEAQIALSHQIPIRENVCGMTGSYTRTTFKWPEKDEGGKSDWGIECVPSLNLTVNIVSQLSGSAEQHDVHTVCFTESTQ